MRVRLGPAFAVFTAAVLLASLVAGAQARSIEISNAERGLRIVWAPLSFEAAGFTVACNATLEGTFTGRTFAKRAGTRIASVTRAQLGSCTGGTARFLTETLPWSMAYAGFTGTLPVMTNVIVNQISNTINVVPNAGPSCLAQTDTSAPLKGFFDVIADGVARVIAHLIEDAASAIPLRGEFFCSLEKGHISGEGTVTLVGETVRPEVRLI